MYHVQVSSSSSYSNANDSICFSDGPDSVNIEGPREVKSGDRLVLNCTADSVPPARFSWSARSGSTQISGSLFNQTVNSSDTGQYTCLAANDKTGRTDSKHINVTVHCECFVVITSTRH